MDLLEHLHRAAALIIDRGRWRTLHVDQFDDGGNFQGRLGGIPISGAFDASTRRLSFSMFHTYYMLQQGTGTGRVYSLRLTGDTAVPIAFDDAGSFKLYALGGKFQLRTYHGDYVSSQPGPDGRLMANVPAQDFVGNPNSSHLWSIIVNADGTVSLRQHFPPFNLLACAEGGGGREVTLSRTAIGAWEKFRLVAVNSEGAIGLQCVLNGQFLTAEFDANQAQRHVVANRDPGGRREWETFMLEEGIDYLG